MAQSGNDGVDYIPSVVWKAMIRKHIFLEILQLYSLVWIKQIRALTVSVQSWFFGCMEVPSGGGKIILTVTFWIKVSHWKSWRNFSVVKPFVGNSWPVLFKRCFQRCLRHLAICPYTLILYLLHRIVHSTFTHCWSIRKTNVKGKCTYSSESIATSEFSFLRASDYGNQCLRLHHPFPNTNSYVQSQ